MNGTKMEVFQNKEFGSVRVVMLDGDPWFSAADVCKALDIANSRDAIAKLDADEKMTVGLTDGHSGARGGAQKMSFVNEPGLYALMMRSRTEDKELTKSEYLRLLDAAKDRPQLHLILETICGTGIRVSELRFFTLEAVKCGEITVSCKSKTRTILLPSKLRKLLLDHAKNNGIHSGPIFITRNGKPLDRSNIWAQMKSLCEAAGVKASKVFPHNLHKLFARTFYGIEKDIAKLADILGHSSIDTTRIYIMTTGTEHRRKMGRLGLVV